MTLEPGLIRALQILSDYFKSRDYRFILIGANVPLILIDWKEADRKGYGIRQTKDVDFSVEVEDWEDYQGLKKDLLELGLVQKDHQPDHRFFIDNLIVDILPYGEAIAKDGVIEWPGTGHRMNVLGFDKLFRYAKPELITKGLTIPVIPLSLLVFSKITAHMDRHLTKDLLDILYVLEHYEEVTVSERRFDVTGEHDLSYEERGAYILGADLGNILSPQEIETVLAFLEGFSEEYSEHVQQLSHESRKSGKEILSLFGAFFKGLHSKR